MPLYITPTKCCEGEDLHVLSCGAHTGTVIITHNLIWDVCRVTFQHLLWIRSWTEGCLPETCWQLSEVNSLVCFLFISRNLNSKSRYKFYPCFQVVCVQDVSSVYRVPLLLEEQGVVSYFCQRLNLPVEIMRPRKMLTKWKEMADRWGSLSSARSSFLSLCLAQRKWEYDSHIFRFLVTEQSV